MVRSSRRRTDTSITSGSLYHRTEDTIWQTTDPKLGHYAINSRDIRDNEQRRRCAAFGEPQAVGVVPWDDEPLIQRRVGEVFHDSRIDLRQPLREYGRRFVVVNLEPVTRR